jgi:tRNA A37 threonylcarbamoyladenosine dehydratase
MGAATRTDPLQIRTDDLKKTKACPLARFVRKRLRLQGIDEGIRCVYSLEPARTAEVSGPRAWSEDDLMRRGRPRAPLGSLSVLTGMFGLIAASEAIRFLTRPPESGAG